MNGTLASEFTGEEDWFFFETTESDVLTVTLTLSDGDNTKSISVYDDKENLLYTGAIEGGVPAQIGLGRAGNFFIKLFTGCSSFCPHNYVLTINLENRAPHGDSTYFTDTKILEIPAVNLTYPAGEKITYKAKLKLIEGSEKLMFELLDASAK